jgi:YVTN family beta-propeller protein
VACFIGAQAFNFNDEAFGTLTSLSLTYPTGTAIQASPSPSVFGQPVTLTATVSTDPNSGTPTGTATFMDGTISLGTVNLTGGQAMLTTSSLKVGAHTITVQYLGDSVHDPSSGTITEFVNPGSTALAVSSTVTVGKLPTGVVASATRAYVANSQSNTVSVIDTTQNPPAVINSIPVGAYPNGMALSADGSQLYVTDYLAAGLTVVDTGTNTVLRTVTVGSRPDGVAVFNGSVYVANLASGTVSQVDPNAGTVLNTITLPSGGVGAAAPSGLVVTAGGTMYVNDVRNGVTIPVTLPSTVGTSVAAGVHPAYISTLGTAGYVASPGDNSIKVLNLATTPPTAATSVAVGAAPYGVVADPAGAGLVVATSSGANTVSAINPGTNTVTATVAVGKTPDAVAISPDGHTAFVTNEADGTVTILQVNP